MPYKVYHGKTGVVCNVAQRAIGIVISKRVANRYISKRINVRIEHVAKSRSREEFIRRVKENAVKKKRAYENGAHVHLKRQPVMPREFRIVDAEENKPETLYLIAYETTI